MTKPVLLGYVQFFFPCPAVQTPPLTLNQIYQTLCQKQEHRYMRHVNSDNLDAHVIEERKKTALHEACKNGHVDCVTFLLTVGASVDPKDNKGQTPLILACKYGHPTIVRLLLKRGADINACNEEGWTSFHMAARAGFYEVLGLLISQLTDKSVINSLTQRTLMSPLHMACLGFTPNHLECRSLLIEAGADYKIKNSRGETPLHVAKYTKYLFNKRADATEGLLLLAQAPQTDTDYSDDDNWSTTAKA